MDHPLSPPVNGEVEHECESDYDDGDMRMVTMGCQKLWYSEGENLKNNNCSNGSEEARKRESEYVVRMG